MKNRRKYDNADTHDLLVMHMQEDHEEFSSVGKRLIRIEIAVYAAAAALGLFIFMIDHPNIIENLTSPAKAETIK